MKLIGLAGNAGVGKSTVAAHMHNQHNFDEYSWASALKRTCAVAFGIPVHYFMNMELKNKEHFAWGMTPRKIMQMVGTEAFRNVIDPEFWIKRLELELSLADLFTSDRIVISDCRFTNEMQWIIDRGGVVIHIVRKDTPLMVDAHPGPEGHSSEDVNAAVAKLVHPGRLFLINNCGSMQDLERSVDATITSLTAMEMI